MPGHQRSYVLPEDVTAWVNEEARKSGIAPSEHVRRTLIAAMHAAQQVNVTREALNSLKSWLKHWQDDKAMGLAPTDGSLNDASYLIDTMLGMKS